jgi:transcriptional regulator with XRE-family HTH domain
MIKRQRYPSSNYNLRDLDVSENLWLWRHRQRSDVGPARGRPRNGAMNQTEAAKCIGLSTQQYSKLENGEAAMLDANKLAQLCHKHSSFAVTNPSVGELCFLARRRSGLSIREVSRQLKMSNVSYNKHEAAGDPRVRDFWMQQGYQFP